MATTINNQFLKRNTYVRNGYFDILCIHGRYRIISDGGKTVRLSEIAMVGAASQLILV